MTIRIIDHVIWIQPNKANMNEVDCGRWNEWDGLWTEEWRRMINEVLTDGNEMKHEH